jgi:hypothetical protein
MNMLKRCRLCANSRQKYIPCLFSEKDARNPRFVERNSIVFIARNGSSMDVGNEKLLSSKFVIKRPTRVNRIVCISKRRNFKYSVEAFSNANLFVMALVIQELFLVSAFGLSCRHPCVTACTA